MSDQDALAPVFTEGLVDDGARKLAKHGLLIVAAVLGGLLVWSIFTRLDSAIIATGEISVEGNTKAIQHLEGGIVAEIAIAEGDYVTAGDLLIRLDDTAVRASAMQTLSRLSSLQAERDRLIAERDDADEIAFALELETLVDAEKFEALRSGQTELMLARRASRLSQIRIQRQKLAQIVERVSGLRTQQDSLEKQIELLDVERVAFERIGPYLRVAQIERQIESVKERMAGNSAEIAAQVGARAEAQLVISQLTDGFLEKVIVELRSHEGEILDLRQAHIAVQDQLHRTEIRAPHSGYVLGLIVHNPGAVIRNGEELMRVVPAGETLVVRSQVRPQDVDRVVEGQAARLVFSSLGGRASPDIDARVLSVSADVFKDSNTFSSFYIATLEFDASDPELSGFVLTPGMPVEAFIRTDGQTVLSYLTRPLTESLNRTFIEE